MSEQSLKAKYNLLLIEKFFDTIDELDHQNDYIVKNNHIIIDYKLNNQIPIVLPLEKIEVVTISNGGISIYGRYTNEQDYEIFLNNYEMTII